MSIEKQRAAALGIRSAFSPREPVNNPLSGEPSRTKQEFKTEVNINEIISRMQRGINPPEWMTSATPHFGDYTDMPTDFATAFAMVAEAEEAFRSLPLDFRRALDHDPRNLDTAPRELFERFGLLKEKIPAEASPTPGNPGVGGRPKADGASGSNVPANELSGSKKGGSKTPADGDE